MESGMQLVRQIRSMIALTALIAAAAAAADAVSVKDAWVRATAPGQKVAGAYMELTSRAEAALVAAASPAAARAELHTMAMEGGVMKMRPVERVALPAGKTVKLAPGGLHVMLVDIKRPLKEGEKVALTLTVELADRTRATVAVEAPVRSLAGAKTHGH